MNQLTVQEYLTPSVFSDPIVNKRILQEIDSYIQEIDLEKVKSFSKDKLNFIEKTLTKHGVDVSKIKKSGEECSKDLQEMFDEGLTPEEASKELVDKGIVVLKTEVSNIVKKVEEMSIAQKIGLSIVGFLVVLWINSVLGSVLLSSFSNVGYPILILIVAPMVEEAVKNYFIQKGLPWAGTGIVFGLEFVIHVVSLLLKGVRLSHVLIGKAIVLLFHFLTTFIQKKIIESIPKEERKRKTYFYAWLSGVAIHSLWNMMPFLVAKYKKIDPKKFLPGVSEEIYMKPFSFYQLLERLDEELEQISYHAGSTGNLVPAEDEEDENVEESRAKPHYTKVGKRKTNNEIIY